MMDPITDSAFHAMTQLFREFLSARYPHGTVAVSVEVEEAMVVHNDHPVARHPMGGCRVALKDQSWDVLFLIRVQAGCPDCMSESLLHEFAHAYWWVRRLRKYRSLREVHDMIVEGSDQQHDDLFGLCYAELLRTIEKAVGGKPLTMFPERMSV